MLSFQRACRDLPLGYSWSNTCRWKQLAGLLNNEFQFRDNVIPRLKDALIAVGSIRATDMANGTLRRCRAQTLAAGLRSRFSLSTEVWEFTITPTVGHARRSAREFFSPATTIPQLSDFAGAAVGFASYWGYYLNEDEHWRSWSRVA